MIEKVNVLGTDYEIIKKSEEEEPYLKEHDGFCSSFLKEIVILDLNKVKQWDDEPQVVRDMSMKETTRHEIVHAFFNESGLRESSNHCEKAWPKNEEMVDWIALQFPKMLKAFQETDCL